MKEQAAEHLPEQPDDCPGKSGEPEAVIGEDTDEQNTAKPVRREE